MNNTIIAEVRPGLIMAILALIFGALWAGYVATHHEQLHGGFEAQVQKIQQTQLQHVMQDMSMDSMAMDAPADHSHDAGTPADHHGGHDAVGHAAGGQHSHSGSLANDAMQRLLRGHIHAMGLGVLSAVLLLIVAFTTIKDCWKKLLGFTFGFGALLYPPAWVIMGFRTVELGPEAAEASIMWLFAPAVGLLLASLAVVLAVLLIEMLAWQQKPVLKYLFEKDGV